MTAKEVYTLSGRCDLPLFFPYYIVIVLYRPRSYRPRQLETARENILCTALCAQHCPQESLESGVQHLLHLKSKSKILRPIEIMGFFYEIFCQIQENNLL